MVDESVIEKILTYLKEKGSTNTFRLASVMGMERDKLLNILKRLEGKQAIRFECGNAIFVKYIPEEKPKPVEIEKPSPRPEYKVKRKPAKSKALQLLQTENTQLQLKLSQLKETVKELEQKAAAHPKTITRTVTKTIIKKVPVIRTVIKKIPVTITKTVTKKILVRQHPHKKNMWQKLKTKSKQFKFPKFNLLRNIQQLKKPEFVK